MFRWAALVAAGICGTALLLLFVLNRPSPLPLPARLDVPLPEAAPPPEMALWQLPTGVAHRNAAFAYTGGALSDARDFVMTAVLVRHPLGDLLIDTGFGREVERHFAEMPLYFRIITRFTRGLPARDQLEAAGYDFKRLRGVVLTHAHWDHASGLADFPGVPVLVSKEERSFVETGGFLSAAARSSGARWASYAFEGKAYLGFPHHHDVYGDGSVVIVPAPGHTPGSVIVFVTLPAGRRYAFVGDLCWQLEGILLREERPFPTRVLGDDDPAAVRAQLSHMYALSQRFPALSLVPAHDARGFAALPVLSAFGDGQRRP
ncbi:MAG: hypothetical protein RL385_2191 [Pseudomonadota bacterium]|jgi:glyoxylase-like metal-dependent hydrolase (beta-lactamase superfamily II)